MGRSAPSMYALASIVTFLCAIVVAGCGTTSSKPGTPDSGGGGVPDATSPYDATVDATTDSGSDAPMFATDGGVTTTLIIDPPSATLSITNPASPPTQVFTATLGMGGMTVTPIWSLTDFTVGSIDNAGTFTPGGTIAGTVTVTASYGGLMAQATLQVTVSYGTFLPSVTLPDGTTIPQNSGAISVANQTALQGPAGPEPDGGAPTTIIYPYDQTVFPKGLLAPVAQFSPGVVAPVDFKVSLDTTGFHWDGFGHIGNPAQLQVALDQGAWNGALESAQPNPTTQLATVTLSIVKAAQGVAYGPAQATLIIAQGKLTGIIYYESYGSDTVDAPPDGGSSGNNGTDFGLWAVKPGGTSPPTNLQSGCVLCHGVSAAGNTLTAGTDDPTVAGNTGVFRVEADGGYTHLATSPTILPYAIGNGVDSRGLGWGVVSPDGRVVVRSQNQFWGGEALLAWAVPDAPLLDVDGGLMPLSTSMTVNGSVDMYAPSFSVDGQHLVYINSDTPAAGSPGAPSRSVGIVDTSIELSDAGADAGSITLSNSRIIYDSTEMGSTPAGNFTKVPTFLPDSQTVVLEETVSAAEVSYAHMLPDYENQMGYVDGELYTLQPQASGAYAHVALANANTGYDPNAATHNYEPKPLPVQVGGYYWVVFTSMRQDAYPTLGFAKKLWVTAVTVGGAPGVDPSHPPFTLVNQSIVAAQPSQRAYWALAPCQANGASCQTSDDCCDGSCRPQSASDPSSPLVCGMPMNMCAQIGDKCQAGNNQDCCNAAAGVQCIGTLNGYGSCEVPAPQ